MEEKCWNCLQGKGECMCDDLRARNEEIEEALGPDTAEMMKPLDRSGREYTE